jgi:cyclopropane fatty-acyl-phospholipid synthase-like methyltransferase
MFQVSKKISAEEIGASYDQISKFFELIWGDSLHVGYWPDGNTSLTLPEAQERFTELLISKTGIKAGQSFLDVGSGTGRPGIHIAQSTGCKVTGITVSNSQVEIANGRAAAAGVKDLVSFQLTDAGKMPFPDASFDAAWAFESFHHMHDRSQVLREIRRVLRPGGRFVLADIILARPMPPEAAGLLSEFWKVNTLLTTEECRTIFPQEGFELEESLDVFKNIQPTLPMGVENMHKRSAEIRKLYGDEMFGMMAQLMPQIVQLCETYLSYEVITTLRR